MAKESPSRNAARKYGIAIIAGFLSVFPLIILEGSFTSWYAGGFPTVLFVGMGVMGAIFTLAGMSAYRDYKEGQVQQRVIVFIFKLAVMVLMAKMWTTLLIGQWPCFLGATGC